MGTCENRLVKWLKFRTKKFRQLIQVNPDILMRLSAQMARRLQVTSEKVGNPGVPRRDGPHCTDSAESGKTTRRYDSPGRYANQKLPVRKSVRLSAVLVKPWDAF